MSRRDQILDMWAAGKPSPEIGNELGLTAARVRRIVVDARADGDDRAKSRPSGRVGSLDLDEAFAMRAAGATRRDIADRFGVSPAAVDKAVESALARNDPRVLRREQIPRPLSYFEREARKRGISRSSLQSKLLTIIRRDQLVSAVLDDGVTS